MFYAANSTGKKFASKRVWADGGVTLSGKLTFDLSEAYVFATADEANAASVSLFRKDAGAAVQATESKNPETYIHGHAVGLIPGYLTGTRPGRHQIEEAMIHGEHELYT